MFEKSKIKRILSQYPKAEESERKGMLEKLISFGEMPINMVAEELRYNRLLYADAVEIFHAVYKNELQEAFIKGLGDPKENIRELFKETIQKLGKGAIVSALIDHLTDDDHMVRKMVGDLLIELNDASIVSRIVPLMGHDSKDVKKTAMDVLSSLKSDKSTEAIIPLLDDSDSWIRRKAVEALCRLKDISVLPKLLDQMSKDSDPAIARAVLEVAGEIGGAQHAKAMLPLVKSQDLVARQKATEAITKIADSSVVMDIMELIANEDVNVRRSAVSILDGIKDPRAASALVKALKDGDWWVRELATDALSELGGGQISKMIMGLLNDKDEYVRRCAVEFYCRVKDPLAYDDLIRLLDDEDWWVREKAIMALGLIGDPDAIESIMKLLSDREVKWAVPKALGMIGGDAAIKPLAKLLKDPQKQVRLEALRALSKIEGDTALLLVKSAVLDNDTQIQEEALGVLRDMTGSPWLIDDVRSEMKEPGVSLAFDEITGAKEIKTGDLLTEAILVVDMCQSTDTASAYGDHTVFKFMKNLNEIISPLSKDENMSYMKSTGDGYLITFGNVASAAQIALKTLELVASRNSGVEKGKKMNLRFAINFGETRVDESGDRLGNAVNTAFRVEGVKKEQMVKAPDEGDEELTEKNRILLTETAYQQLTDEPTYKSRLLGFFELKGLTGLHRIYEMSLPEQTRQWLAQSG